MGSFSANHPFTVWIDGWRGINHSYAMLNQHQLLQFDAMPDLRVLHTDAPFARATWSRESNPSGFAADDQRRIDSLRSPAPDDQIDCIYRIASPFRIPPQEETRRFVSFFITELGLSNGEFENGQPAIKPFVDGDRWIQTSSNWSRDRIVDFGFPQERVAVVPLGVDAQRFRPLNQSERAMSRATLGIKDDETLFFCVGAPFFTKGSDVLLRAFSRLVHKGRRVRLILKDQKDVYGVSAEDMIQQIASREPKAFSEKSIAAMSFVHNNISLDLLRIFMSAADCYVSAYRAEGFNLPVLEAIACGTPVVVTAGGATDDFCDDNVAIRVPGALQRYEQRETGLTAGAYIEPDFDELVEAMDLFASGTRLPPESLEEARKRIVARFSWERSAQAIVRLLKGASPEELEQANF